MMFSTLHENQRQENVNVEDSVPFFTFHHILWRILANNNISSKNSTQKTEDACFFVWNMFFWRMRLWRCDVFTWPNATFYGRSTSFCESLQESYLLGSPHCFTGSWHFSEQPMVALWIRFQIVNLEEERFNLLETKLRKGTFMWIEAMNC